MTTLPDYLHTSTGSSIRLMDIRDTPYSHLKLLVENDNGTATVPRTVWRQYGDVAELHVITAERYDLLKKCICIRISYQYRKEVEPYPITKIKKDLRINQLDILIRRILELPNISWDYETSKVIWEESQPINAHYKKWIERLYYYAVNVEYRHYTKRRNQSLANTTNQTYNV